MPGFSYRRGRRPSAGAVLLAFAVVGCGTDKAVTTPSSEPAPGFSVQAELASDFDPTAPTTVGIVTFSADVGGITSAFIDFGLDTTYGMRAPVNLDEPGHRTLLLGMKPSREYHYRISASDGTKTYASDDYVVRTGPPTTLVSVESFTVLDAAAREPGFVIGSYWRGEVRHVPFILDADGEIVWWYARGPEGIARAIMSADGKNLWMAPGGDAGAPLQRVTMDGLEEQTYPTRASHDMTPVLGATMAFLDYRESDCDSISEIDPSGIVTEVFESEGVVDPDAGQSGCHGNAIHYLPDRDAFTFSDRDQDLLLVDRSGSVLWRLAELVPGGNAAWGGVQHGHHFMDDSVVMFANRGPDLRSTIFEYTLEGQEILRYDGESRSTVLGDVQRLPGGNLLVTYSASATIHEVDAEHRVVLDIKGATGASGAQSSIAVFGYSHWTRSLYPSP